jgi:hypothetical protein
MFLNKVLRRMFGSKREEVEGGWRKLHNEELISQVIKSRSMRWARHAACTREIRNAFHNLV